MDRKERIVVKDATCSPRGVASKMKLNSPASIAEKARQRNMRLCPHRSLFPGNSDSVARYPGMRSTKIRAGSERMPCKDGGDRWTRAKAITGINTDIIRCQGSGQASLIFFIIPQLMIKPFSYELMSISSFMPTGQ